MVRNRLGVILDVREFGGQQERQYLVRVNYKDSFTPDVEELLWNIEPGFAVLEPAALPRCDSPPMKHQEIDALVRSCRWNALQPYLDMNCFGEQHRSPIAAPFYGAVSPDDYQLVPLLKALRMPRVNLMIADDVGLGKTIEAGLIVNELLIRRRINRVLIICPASLRTQWQEEMQTKFSLPFQVVDHDSTVKLRREVGIDANPWRHHNRIITSYHYLKQSLIFEQFKATQSSADITTHLPWDMLIVDEAHNLMPSPFGKDSDLCVMLRQLAPMFEHKLFLTATPHNGNSVSFSGLLEMLDPARFRKTEILSEAEKRRVRQVVVRRMKSEINARTNPPKFCKRNEPQALDLDDIFSCAELRLIFAVEEFKARIRAIINTGTRRRQMAGFFAIEVLGKRLLSGPMTFIESWKRCKDSLQSPDTEATTEDELESLKRSLAGEVTDDREAQALAVTAAAKVGAWLKDYAEVMAKEIREIDEAIAELGVILTADIITQNPNADARYQSLQAKIDDLLFAGRSWRDDERLVIFTEYKTTQDYLLRRLQETFKDNECKRIAVLYGGMDDASRDNIKQRFNDEADPVRILIATDAASEGLNLQETARYVLHYDCPWNPSRLEQRNGRLDRHSQARDVSVFHFSSTTAADLGFLAKLMGKIHQIREDLGAVSDLFDQAIQRRIVKGDQADDLFSTVEQGAAWAKSSSQLPGDADHSVTDEEMTTINDQLADFAAELDLDDAARHNVLDRAMSGHITQPEADSCFKITKPDLSGWKDTIDASLRVGGSAQALPRLTFSIEPFMKDKGGRTVFRNRPDVRMLHLGHPVMRKAANLLSRHRYPCGDEVSRWTLRQGRIPAGADAIIRLHYEEMAVNELRESFHNWVRTVDFPVVAGQLQAPLPHEPASRKRLAATPLPGAGEVSRAQEIFADVSADLRRFLLETGKELNTRIAKQLLADRAIVSKNEQEAFQSRNGELSTLIHERTIEAKRKELSKLFQERNQLFLFAEEKDQLDDSIEALQKYLKDDEIHYEELRAQLERERKRIIEYLIPRRYTLDGSVQVYPIAVEIILPQTGGEK
jgi:ERCC4-related helicase